MELHSLGRYLLVEPFRHASALSRFYLARHEDDPKDETPGYIVKLLLPGEGESAAQIEAQFVHESELLALFNHPSIPTLHAKGSQDGVRFIVMDYVDGVDLSTLLGHAKNEPRALTKELAVYIMGQLADALHHVHTAERELNGGEVEPLDVLHRDICPANVYLSREGDVQLGDFGSASSKLLAPEFTAKEAGHMAYKAPERVTGSGEATTKSDLFSLAVCLWEILKGQRCLQAEDELKTMDAIVRFDISHSTRRVSGLSPKLSEIVRRNLDRDPGRRYTGAYQVLQRLAQSPEAQQAESSREELARLVKAVARGDA
jgi:serine/threonine-protein kinase